MSGSALLVIDAQRNMFEVEPGVHEGLELLGRISGLIGRAREAGAPVIFVRNSGAAGDPDERGVPGWELTSALPRLSAEPIVDKLKSDAFDGTNLNALLRARGVRRVVVCGLQSEFCIAATSRGAKARGYEVVLVSDAHSTFDEPGATAVEIIARENAALADVADVIPGFALKFD